MLLLAGLSNVAGAPPNPHFNRNDMFQETRQDEEQGKLNVIHISTEKLEAVYNSPDGNGVHIHSAVNGESSYLAVRNLEGEILVLVEKPNTFATSLTILGWQFLILNNTVSNNERYLTGYAVPHAYSQGVTDAVKKERINHKVLRHLDFDGANNSRTIAMGELIMRQEVAILRDAAFSLGKRGIIGNENPAAMQFYLLAMKLTKRQNQQNGQKQAAQREKRSHCWFWKTHCSNNDKCCYKCPVGGNCLGMCGVGCEDCWPWVCGTCCNWRACYDHDICCDMNWESWGCQFPLLVPFVSCFIGSWCYSDSTAPWPKTDPPTQSTIESITQSTTEPITQSTKEKINMDFELDTQITSGAGYDDEDEYTKTNTKEPTTQSTKESTSQSEPSMKPNTQITSGAGYDDDD